MSFDQDMELGVSLAAELFSSDGSLWPESSAPPWPTSRGTTPPQPGRCTRPTPSARSSSQPPACRSGSTSGDDITNTLWDAKLHRGDDGGHGHVGAWEVDGARKWATLDRYVDPVTGEVDKGASTAVSSLMALGELTEDLDEDDEF